MAGRAALGFAADGESCTLQSASPSYPPDEMLRVMGVQAPDGSESELPTHGRAASSERQRVAACRNLSRLCPSHQACPWVLKSDRYYRDPRLRAVNDRGAPQRDLLRAAMQLPSLCPEETL